MFKLFSINLFISLIFILSFIQISVGNYIKVKRNDGAEISSTLDLAFAPLERNENPASIPVQRLASFSPLKSEEGEEEEELTEENEQKHEVERMVILQNLNYLDDVITNLETEKQNLENLWKSSTADSETSLHRAAKSLWQKTSKQILVLNEKKKELMENLKKLTFDDKLQTFIAASDINENDKNDTKSSSSSSVAGSGSSSTSTTASEKKDSSSSVSKAICQFFVFGTLFGVVITITVCTCFLQPRQQRQSRQCRVSSISNLNPSRIPEPFDYSKPCFLKADSTGKFYASPIDGEEIPPLPTYEAALALPRSPSSSTDGDEIHQHHQNSHENSLDSITVIDSIEAPFPKERTERF